MLRFPFGQTIKRWNSFFFSGVAVPATPPPHPSENQANGPIGDHGVAGPSPEEAQRGFPQRDLCAQVKIENGLEYGMGGDFMRAA